MQLKKITAVILSTFVFLSSVMTQNTYANEYSPDTYTDIHNEYEVNLITEQLTFNENGFYIPNTYEPDEFPVKHEHQHNDECNHIQSSKSSDKLGLSGSPIKNDKIKVDTILQIYKDNMKLRYSGSCPEGCDIDD